MKHFDFLKFVIDCSLSALVSHEFLIFRQQQKDSNWDDNYESWIQGLHNMMTVRITWASCHLATLVTREVDPQTSNTNPSFKQKKSHEEKFIKN